MICRSCGHVNREGELMCNDCGDFLPVGTITSMPESDIPYANEDCLVLFELVDAVYRIKVRHGVHVTIGREMAIGDDEEINNLARRLAQETGISRSHADLFVNGGTLMLVDLESTNGTYVNGQRIMSMEPCALKSNDTVAFGALEAQVYLALVSTDTLLA